MAISYILQLQPLHCPSARLFNSDFWGSPDEISLLTGVAVVDGIGRMAKRKCLVLTLWVGKSRPPLTQSDSIWQTGKETQQSATLHIAFLFFWGLLGGFPETGSNMRHKDIKLQLRISFTDQKCILDHRSALWISAKRFSGFENDFKHSFSLSLQAFLCQNLLLQCINVQKT